MGSSTSTRAVRCPMPDHPPCQIIPHPLAQSASAPGSHNILQLPVQHVATRRLDSTEIRQVGDTVYFYF